jgi:hypothetical protein
MQNKYRNSFPRKKQRNTITGLQQMYEKKR